MVLAVNPVMLLPKAPLPVPSDVLLFAIVGLAATFQQTPRAVTEVPPSLVIFPPLTALFFVMLVRAVVVTSGRAADAVVKLISLPYTATPSRLQ